MAWLNLLLRRMAVAAALLVLCVVDASLVGARTASDYTAAQQASTLQFLQGFVTANPSLSAVWTGTDFCSWSYVTCDSYFADKLDFSPYSSPYSGTLVLPELGDDVNGSAVIFTYIQVRSMGVRVTGTLPASWGRLTRLETLYLNGNGLTGTLPSAWGGMTKLGTLGLQNNKLSGSLPPQWRFLSKLYTMYLQNNTLSGTLPAEWGRLSSLNALYLNDNALTGTLPAAWGAAAMLRYLYLNNNQLVGSIPRLWSDMRSISAIQLMDNRLCGCIPQGSRGSLLSYYVDAAVSASDCATANVCEVQSATGAEDSDAGAVLTANEKQTLAFLRLVGAAVGGALQSSWSGVWYCVWPNVECDASGLATVDLSGVALSAAVQLPELTEDIDGGLVDVTTFKLYGKGAMVAGTLPSSWGRLAKLSTLHLHGNALSGTLPSAWSGMTKLYTLHLENNTLSGSLPLEWRFLRTLYEVYLSNNTLSASVPAAWIGMSSVYKLYLDGNELSGTLPEEWGSMRRMRYLYLNNNELVGSIPSQWGSMKQLYYVYLTGNKLCGCVPKEWKAAYVFHYYVDPAVSASDCATVNVCEVQNATGAEDSDAGAVLTANEKQTLAFLRLVGAAVGGALQSSWSGVWYCSWPNVECDASGLATVDLSGVALSAAVQLPELTEDIDGGLVDVTTFKLYGKGAMVAGTLPSSWGRLAKLSTLHLHGNALIGTLPSAWSGMTKLYTLHLENNTLSGSLPSEWGSMAKLSSLYLNSNALSGTLPVSWAPMTSLTYLYLNNNQLNGEVPEEWTGMTGLSSVYLKDNHFCGCLPEKWRSSYSPFVSAGEALKSDRCAVLNRCTSGSESGDSLEGMTSEEVSTLKFLRGFIALNPSLASIWTGNYYCGWAYVSCSSNSPSLDFADYRYPAYSGTLVLPELGDDVNGSAVIFTVIKVRSMSGRVTGTLPASWSRLTALKTLYLDGNSLTGTLPSSWGSLASLTSLYVNDNNLAGSLPSAWSGMSSLSTLHLENNQLSGSLPAAWGSLIVLKAVYLQNNALSGTLPVEWTSMGSLRYLYLSTNELTGSIPSEWGETWSSSFEVALEVNRLCGCLPSKWKRSSVFLSITVDAAVRAADCAVKNACDALPSTTTTSTTTTTTTTTTTAAPVTPELTNTLKFLETLRTVDVSLSEQWTGTDYCGWAYVSCTADGSVELDLSTLPLTRTAPQSLTGPMAKAVTSSVAASLPELTDDTDGSLVRVTTFKLRGKGAVVAGTLPLSWGRLTKLETLYLDGNGLTGTLPSAWGGMASLRALNLSGSRLSGSVPASWGGLWQLLSVDLTGTGLCGCVPAEWAGKAVVADAALTGSDCASANACPAETSAPAPPPSRKTKSGPNLIPLWCVLGALGGVLVGVAVGLGVRFYRRRRREEELRLFQAQQDNEMEPFRKTTDTPY